MNSQPRTTRWPALGASLATAALSAALCACGGGYGGGVRPEGGGNPSPLAGSSVSQEANQRADAAMYRPVTYTNGDRKGPRIIVLPGEIKSNNASFVQHVTANNIADFGELELSRANFTIVERSNLGPLLHEAELAYSMGDPNQARRVFQKGKLQTTKWVVKFDVLKAEQVATGSSGFDGGAAASLINIFSGGSKAGAAGAVTAGSVRTDQAVGVWVIGMRYKVIDANTTEQVANGYFEDKMEMGRTSTSVLGVSKGASGQLTLDSLVQRLVQKNVAEIDAKYK
jgi:hypothetical protein